jgi:hypothetical protein
MRIRLAVVMLALFLVGAFLLLALVATQDFLVSIDTDRPTPEEIRSFGRIAVPEDATNLRSYIRGSLDTTAWVRFDIPANREAHFVATLPRELILSPEGGPKDRMINYRPGRDWWTPGNARRFLAGEVGSRGYTQYFLIDRTDPLTRIIYVLTDEF